MANNPDDAHLANVENTANWLWADGNGDFATYADALAYASGLVDRNSAKSLAKSTHSHSCGQCELLGSPTGDPDGTYLPGGDAA